MSAKRFRSGSIVWWEYGGKRIYGVVQGLRRTRYNVLSVAGDKMSRLWAMQPHHMTFVHPDDVPPEVSAALAYFTLTGKVLRGDNH